MADVSFANWRARRIIENINYVVDLCFPGDQSAPLCAKWNDAATAWRETIKVCLFVKIFNY